MSQGVRRQARAYALQVLFAADVAGHEELPPAGSDTWAALELEIDEAALGFAQELIDYVGSHRAGIDDRIQTASKNWRLERMSRVDRNILRLAVAELSGTGNAPRGVVINEAVELAKRFGSDDSAAFVNGILDRIAKDLSASS